MELLDFAIQTERDAQKVYAQAAHTAKNPAVKRMCQLLHEDEKRHEEMLLAMKKDQTEFLEGRWDQTRNVYSEMLQADRALIDESDDLGRLLAKAKTMEHTGADMYQKLADQLADPKQKNLILRLKGEEIKHEKIVENAWEYVTNPATVLEDPEFLWYGHEDTP